MESGEALLGAIRSCTNGLNAVDGAGPNGATLHDLNRIATQVAAVLDGEPDRPAARGTYFLGYAHPAMKRMIETGVDAGPTGALGAALVELRAAVAAVVGRTRWAGAAGEQAKVQLIRIGEWFGGTGRALEAAARARSAMPEPVDFSMNAVIGVLERETDPVRLRDTIQAINTPGHWNITDIYHGIFEERGGRDGAGDRSLQ